MKPILVMLGEGLPDGLLDLLRERREPELGACVVIRPRPAIDGIPWEISATREVLEGRDPFNNGAPLRSWRNALRRGEKPIPNGAGSHWHRKRCRK